ncbi:hypothetical protein GJ496_009404 [Pomphorhynchus laevis]|nr:hypothetical protein GJ496_009404 [Pomphorhynchus laevis]
MNEELSFSSGPGKNLITAVRARPLLSSKNDSSNWKFHCAYNAVESVNNDSLYHFDKVYNTDDHNENLFNDLVAPLVDSCVNGINGTFFLYGQTASGKTHTMFGADLESGLVDMAIERSFQTIYNRENRNECMVFLSCVEIYNEVIFDLMSDDLNVVTLQDVNGVFKLKNTIEIAVDDVDAAVEQIQCVANRRRVAVTSANHRSSRSHCIIQMKIESHDSINTEDTCVVGVLHLLDLAGSETININSDEPSKIRETCKINRSLLHLTTVIRSLSEGSRFVDYRSSQLTKILKTSLSGNANVCLLGCIRLDQERESRNTLQFIQCARQVIVRPRVNIVMKNEATIRRYQKQIDKLQDQLLLLLKQHQSNAMTVEEKLRSQLEDEYRSKLARLQKFLHSSKNSTPLQMRATEPRPNRKFKSWAPEIDTFCPPIKIKCHEPTTKQMEFVDKQSIEFNSINDLFRELKEYFDTRFNHLENAIGMLAEQSNVKQSEQVETVKIYLCNKSIQCGNNFDDDLDGYENKPPVNLLANRWLRSRVLKDR